MRTQIQRVAERYLKLVRWSDEDGVFVGSIPDLCGDCCHGDTEAEVYEKLVLIAEDLVADYLEEGSTLKLPPVSVRPMRELVAA
jgi:predicted RNase H-like HicB family nuclease